MTTTARKQTASTDLVLTMNFSKSTKGTYVYHADDADAPITALYIRKAAYGTAHPDSIQVTVEAA